MMYGLIDIQVNPIQISASSANNLVETVCNSSSLVPLSKLKGHSLTPSELDQAVPNTNPHHRKKNLATTTVLTSPHSANKGISLLSLLESPWSFSDIPTMYRMLYIPFLSRPVSCIEVVLKEFKLLKTVQR